MSPAAVGAGATAEALWEEAMPEAPGLEQGATARVAAGGMETAAAWAEDSGRGSG